MSLLSIVKMVMDSNGWPNPIQSVASSQDQNMRQSYALANKALESASFKKDWPILVREHQFETVIGQSVYPLPLDFHHLVSPSAVNSDQYYQLKGSLTPIQWYRMALKGAVNWSTGFRITPFTKEFNIAPAPTGVQKLVFMYVTMNIATSADGNPVPRYTQDNDVAVIDESLVELGLTWRWRQKKGLDYTAEMAEYNGTLNRAFAQMYGAGETDVGGYSYQRALADQRFGQSEPWPLTGGDIGSGPIGG
jgi:hypothetical protein